MWKVYQSGVPSNPKTLPPKLTNNSRLEPSEASFRSFLRTIQSLNSLKKLSFDFLLYIIDLPPKILHFFKAIILVKRTLRYSKEPFVGLLSSSVSAFEGNFEKF